MEAVDTPIFESNELIESLQQAPGSEADELTLRGKIGAVLFVSIRPLSAEAIAEAVGADLALVELELEQIAEILQQAEIGFCLVAVAGSYQLRSVPAAGRVIQNLIPPKARRLSKAAAETLAVIAYKQPVQRAEIEAIRGVDALPTIKTLLDARLIRVVGRDDSVGQPTLYGTTTQFLERFGLKDLSELPSTRELTQLAEEPGEAETQADLPFEQNQEPTSERSE